MVKKLPDKTLLDLLPADEAQRLKDILASLASVRTSDPSLMQVELQFFEVLSILRGHSDCKESARLLATLRLVQHDQYAKTQDKGVKIKSSIATIRKFKLAFKLALFNALHHAVD
jgi:hypothetical protein